MTRRTDITNDETAHKGVRAIANTDSWQDSLRDWLMLIGVMIACALALAAFAVAAPIILIVSSLVGLIARNGSRKGWRDARMQKAR